MGYVYIIGTRPEAIKLAPLILELPGTVVLTGQHPTMARDALASFGITADIDLEGSGDIPCEGTVIAQGDTRSVLDAATAAYVAGVPFAHVEAGLRSHDLARPWPEEGYRRMVGQIASYHFAPTPTAAANLAAESVPGSVHVTGNTVIDALRICDPLPAPDGPDVLVTMHRREALGDAMHAVLSAVAGTRRRVAVMSHPNPAVRAIVEQHFPDAIAPLPYREFLSLLASARVVLTDSGGLQEECAYLGIPALVCREVTERPEGVESGCARVIGFDGIADALDRLDDYAEYRRMAEAACPYGDGHAAKRIAEVLTCG